MFWNLKKSISFQKRTNSVSILYKNLPKAIQVKVFQFFNKSWGVEATSVGGT